MKTKPLIQLREMIAAALSSMTNLGKSFRTFIIETMELYLTSSGRMNFTQMARCGRSCESRFRQNFKKTFDWLSFNRRRDFRQVAASPPALRHTLKGGPLAARVEIGGSCQPTCLTKRSGGGTPGGYLAKSPIPSENLPDICKE